MFENLVSPQALAEGLDNGISYWRRGGELGGLAIQEIGKNIHLEIDWKIPESLPCGQYEMRIGLKHSNNNQEMISLANENTLDNSFHSVGIIHIIR